MALGTLIGPLPKLGLGCWLFGNAPPGSDGEKTALEVVGTAYDAGVRHFDTAFDYGRGRSEEILGKALAGRPEAFIASKIQMTDPSSAVKGLEACLSRLGRESIDLFYVHWPKTGMDPRPMMEALEGERARGRIRHIGVSNFSVSDLDAVREVGTVDAYQVGYNLLWRWPEDDVLPYCRKAGISIVTYSSLAQGLLTGKFSRTPRFEPGDPRPETVFYDGEVWPHVYEAVEEMKAVAEGAGFPLSSLALRWLTDLVGVDLVLAGARTVDQLRENIGVFDGKPARKDLELIDSVSARLRPHVPDIGNMFKYYP
jgi:myo-inositol catabolism protein IolS